MKMKMQLFASTNATANLGLSQYIGTDKPTYLGDYNSDMLKIDTAVKNNSDDIGINEAAIGTLTNLDTTTKSNLVAAVNEVNAGVGTNATAISNTNTNIGTLSNLNTTNKTNVVSAVNEVNNEIQKLNLTTFTTYDTNNGIVLGNIGGSLQMGTITIAKNDDGSVAKIYGYIVGTAPADQRFYCTIANTGLTPDTDIIIAPCGITALDNANGLTGQSSVEIGANGTVTLKGTISDKTQRCWFMPCLYFIKDFGDTDLF